MKLRDMVCLFVSLLILEHYESTVLLRTSQIDHEDTISYVNRELPMLEMGRLFNNAFRYAEDLFYMKSSYLLLSKQMETLRSQNVTQNKENITSIWTNVENIYKHIKSNRDKIKKKCSKTKCNSIVKNKCSITRCTRMITQINKLKTKVDFISLANITVLENLLELLKNTTAAELIFELKTNLTKIQTRVDLLETTVIKLNVETSALNTKVNSLENKISTLETEVNSLKSSASADKCDSSTCSSLSTTQTALQSSFSSLSTSLQSSFSSMSTSMQSSISSLSTTQASVQSSVTNLDSCFSDKSSSLCPSAASGKKSITGAINELETPPVFMCHWFGGDFATSGTLKPYDSCDINVGNVVDKTTGKFTVAKPGKYRLTFMSLMYPIAKKKVIAFLVKTTGGTETSIARSVAQSKIGTPESQITTTIDIIYELAASDTIHVFLTLVSGSKISGSSSLPRQVVFSGQFIS